MPGSDEITPTISNGEYQLVPIGDVERHPSNPRTHDIDAIRESIRASGFVGAIVVQSSTRLVIAGNGRHEAAELEGMPVVPVIWHDCDDATATRILLADNRASDRSGYDEGVLLALLRDVNDNDGLAGTLWSDDDLQALLDRAMEADPDVPDPDGNGGVGNNIDERFMVVIECADESQQVTLIDRLAGEGLNVRAVMS